MKALILRDIRSMQCRLYVIQVFFCDADGSYAV